MLIKLQLPIEKILVSIETFSIEMNNLHYCNVHILQTDFNCTLTTILIELPTKNIHVYYRDSMLVDGE
jgi:hypothetical protein